MTSNNTSKRHGSAPPLPSLAYTSYGHYKAAAHSDLLSEIHALMTELAVTGGTPLAHWESGLSVMLEKQKGVIQVDKLRAILLMEADFNFYHRSKR